MTLFSRTGTLLLTAVSLSCVACGGDGVIALLSSGADGNGGGGDVDAGGSGQSPAWRRSCAEASDPDCPPEAPHCDPTLGLCGECVEDTQCWFDFPTSLGCTPSVGLCVECTKTEDCLVFEKFCNVALAKCVECVDDSDCTVPGTVCNRAKGECAQTCSESTSCAFLTESLCDPTLGICVECLTMSDCLAGSGCTTNSRECRTKF